MTDRQGVFGIDLGTTYSAVGYIDDTGHPTVVRNNYGDDTTPSVVYFESETNVVVGTVAKESAVAFPNEVVSLVKREMGNEKYRRSFHGKEFSAPAISAFILEALAKDAEIDSQRKLERAVITVPAYFGMVEKAATRQAGELAGIEVIGIVPEPVAAALSYGLGKDADGKTILVYDLGGGTFDVTVIRIGTDEIRVLVVDGDSHLGGADWDEVLINHVVAEVAEQMGDDSITDDDTAMQEIANQVEKIKRRLSVSESATVIVHHTGGAAKVPVTRVQFEQMTAHLVERTLDVTQRAIDTVEELHPGTMAQVSDILLVGGSTWMPAVGAALRTRFGWEAKLADPDLAVAKGAALYSMDQWGKLVELDTAAGESGDTPVRAPAVAPTESEQKQASEAAEDQTGIDAERFLAGAQRDIVSALPKAIGIKLVDTTVSGWDSMPEPPSYIEHLVVAQTRVPLTQPVSFVAKTVAANQSEIMIEIWEQAGAAAGRELGANRKLSEGPITGLAAYNLPARSPIEIQFTINGDGVATVDAVEPTSGRKVQVEAKIELLSEAEMEAERRARDGMSAGT